MRSLWGFLRGTRAEETNCQCQTKEEEERKQQKRGEVCGDARGNNGPINQRRLEAQKGLEYVLRIGPLAWLDPSTEQVLKKSMTGTTRRCDSGVLIC
jgi:hypothetical protein